MRTRKSFLLAAGVIASSAMFALTEVRANPAGVPVNQPGPLSCSTANFTIDAVLGVHDEFPIPTPCIVNTGDCSEYRYRVTKLGSKNPDHIVVAVSADQNLDSAGPSAFVTPPGPGDSATGFLANARHEYPVRVNPTPQAPARIVIVGSSSSPRISTVLVKSGNNFESCLIAGPGITGTGDPFQPVFQEQLATVAGGKCIAQLHFDDKGKLIDVTTDTEGCFEGSPPLVEGLKIGGEKIRNNTGPHGITFGDNTTTCYGPPVPSPARCICTKFPCP